MRFACVYIPDFLVQAVMRAQLALREGPLALLGGAPPLWSVVAANPAAFDAGIQLGMTKAQVTQFTNVQICMRSEAQEQAAHAALLDAAWSISPRVEDAAADTVILDLEGLTSLFGDEEKIAQELARRIAAIGLAARIAVAANIEVAIHAARGFPGITLISAGQERRRLGPLPVGVLTTATETLEILERWGVATLQALAGLPVLQLSERLGPEGVRLSELARGVRQRSLALAQASSTFTEEMELDDAVEELEPLSFLLGRLLDQLCARLEARALAVRAVRVQFELQPSFEKDFQTLKEDLRSRPAAKVFEKVLTLPVPMHNPKTLLKLLRLQLQGNPPAAPIQKIYMSADAAAPRVMQNGLFVPSGPDPEKLEVTIARLEKLVGEGNLGFAELLDSHRPESFRMQRFVAIAEQRRANRLVRAQLQPSRNAGEINKASAAAGPESTKVVSALRMLRPPQAVRVELRNEQPARVYLHGMRGEVVAASGPWRSSGDWWQEDPWHQDEWDLEVEFVASSEKRRKQDTDVHKIEIKNCSTVQRALYRIYFDTLTHSWFLRGEYD
jgi:protein ImuB